MSADAPNTPVDHVALLRSKQYRNLLVIAAVLGVLVSTASWAFLELVHVLQEATYETLPSGLGFDEVPWWWPLPVLTVAGMLTAVAVVRLPGHGGHLPYAGIKAGATDPADLPGILLAAFATLGLGLVLGPEGPLIASSTGLAMLAVRSAKKDTPDQAMAILTASAAFAAIASVFGSPVVGTIILIEAAGLGGPMLTLVLLPGLMSAGIGSLVFTGIGRWAGLDSSDYALTPLSLPPFSSPTVAQFGWSIILAIGAAVLTAAIVEGSRASDRLVSRRPFVLLPTVGLAIASAAIAFGQITDRNELAVLFSGQEAFSSVFEQAPETTVATLAVLLVCKGVAWSLSMGSFRGGPTFPALFLGAVLGLMAARLPGLSETPAVVILIAAMAVSILRLPLSAVLLTLLLTADAGITTAPLAITSAVVAYITTLSLSALLEERRTPTPQPQSASG
jgi:H+/Cl- antiporter ClcA